MFEDDNGTAAKFDWLAELPDHMWQKTPGGSWVLEVPLKDLISRAGLAIDTNLTFHFHNWAQDQCSSYAITWIHKNPPRPKVVIVRSDKLVPVSAKRR